MILFKKYPVILLVITLFGVTGCSSKLIYNNLDWIATWYIDDFVTLNDTQEDQFEPALERFLTWHRQSELQRYILQIKHIKSDINNGIKQSDVKAYISVFKRFWRSALIYIEPSIVKLAYTLQEDQVIELLDEIEQRNLERLEEFNEETPEERLADRLERIEDRVETFIGDLTEQQRHLLQVANNSSQSAFLEWIEYRRAWANSIRSAYTLQDDKLAFERAIRYSVLNGDSFRSDVYWEKIEHNQKIWIATFTQLIGSLNKKQLKKLNKKLDDYIEDFEALAQS